MAREKTNWFHIWYEDKQGILNTMVRNMTSDLNHGYDYFGKNIRRQRKMIEEYKAQFDEEMKGFRTMEESKIQHWCYYDLKRRGAIA